MVKALKDRVKPESVEVLGNKGTKARRGEVTMFRIFNNAPFGRLIRLGRNKIAIANRMNRVV